MLCVLTLKEKHVYLCTQLVVVIVALLVPWSGKFELPCCIHSRGGCQDQDCDKRVNTVQRVRNTSFCDSCPLVLREMFVFVREMQHKWVNSNQISCESPCTLVLGDCRDSFAKFSFFSFLRHLGGGKSKQLRVSVLF